MRSGLMAAEPIGADPVSGLTSGGIKWIIADLVTHLVARACPQGTQAGAGRPTQEDASLGADWEEESWAPELEAPLCV